MNKYKSNLLANCAVEFKAPPIAAVPVCQQQWLAFSSKCEPNKQEENTMTANTERDYLNRRLTDARYAKRAALEHFYKIYADTQPRSYKELIDWVKNEKFELDTKRTKVIDANIEADEHYNIFGCFDGIVFTGRGKQDHDGYTAAEAEMLKHFQSAKDVINTDDAKEGLKALQEFEAWFPKGYKAPTKH